MSSSRLVLCADDFAISRGTSEVIAGLLRSGSINAVSCMAALPGWPADAELLLEAANTNPQAEVGLHLTLSSEIPIGELSCLDSLGRLPGPDHLLGLCLTRRIRASEFAAEIDRQFDAFEASMFTRSCGIWWWGQWLAALQGPGCGCLRTDWRQCWHGPSRQRRWVRHCIASGFAGCCGGMACARMTALQAIMIFDPAIRG